MRSTLESLFALTDAHRLRWITFALLALALPGNSAGFVIVPACYVLYAELRSIRTRRLIARELRAYLVSV